MVFEKPAKEGRLLAALLFSVGILQIAGYWFAGAMVNGDGPLAIPQPDAALYLQSARRVAEGFPFSFSSGSAVSTGSTTVLHPFVFALPFLLGIGPDSAIACSFAINAVFYLIFLFGWLVVIRRWVSDPFARLLAVLMLGLFGQTAYAALALSDIGFWLAVSGMFMAGFVTDRKWLYGSMLILGPWVRPEGMVLAIAFALVVIGVRIFKKERSDRIDIWLAVAAVVSMFAVFALNYSLTGAAQFSSVAKKGHFATRPFSAALYCSATDLISMASAFFFGLTNDPPRQFYALPVAGAVAFWIGVVAHKWGDWRKLVYPLAVSGGIWTVATSGWQNTNVDRYLAWVMPLAVLFSAEGLVVMFRRLAAFRAAWIVVLIPLLFSAGSSATLWAFFNVAATQSDVVMKFGRELDSSLPDGSTVGLTGSCGFAYPLRHHGVRSLYGIYSPEFEGPLISSGMETLKLRPETRFDYWLFAADDDFPKGFAKTQGDPLALGPDGFSVCKADWSLFDVSAAVPSESEGLTLRARMDVGFPADERAYCYQAETRYGLSPLSVFQHVGELNGKVAYEAGRVIWGMDSMSVPLESGKDVLVIMRTLREKDAGVPSPLGSDRARHFDFGASQRLNIAVDGKLCGVASYDVDAHALTDVKIRIPGSAIVNPVSRIAFMGDHIACCYWFFQ